MKSIFKSKISVAEEMRFSNYMEQTAWSYLHLFLLAQVVLVPLHILTTDYIDEEVRFSTLSIASRLLSALFFVAMYLIIKKTKANYQIYVGITFLVNAVGDAYLASLSSEKYLVTHMLGLAVVFIAYALIVVWRPLFYQLVLFLSIAITAVLFYFNSPLPLISIMKEGGGFLIFLVAISMIINYMRFTGMKNQFDNLSEIRSKNEELQASEEELKQNLEELETSQENLKLQKESLEMAMEKVKSTQNQLVRAERMASVGNMTNGLAHEISNPLNFISGGLQAFSAMLPDFMDMAEVCSEINLENQNPNVKKKVESLRDNDLEEMQEDVEYVFKDMSQGVDRIVHIVNGLNLFANADKEEKSKANLHDMINMAFDTVKKQNEEIMITRNYDPSIKMVECFPAQLTTVFRNILSNSFDAISGKGNVYVFTKRQNDKILIEISDDGAGIKMEKIEKVFKPFFTTKSMGNGTGLGLSIVHGIIEKHLGEVSVDSQLGEGFMVRILLPITIEDEGE